LSFIYINSLLGYVHHMGAGGDVSWQFQLALHCTLFTLPPSFLPLSPLPTPLKAIARGFLVLFHIGIWSPSAIYRHLNLLPFFKFFIYFLLFYYSYVHTRLGSFLPPAPSIPSRNYFILISNFFVERV
jgi:hypothetical protein